MSAKYFGVTRSNVLVVKKLIDWDVCLHGHLSVFVAPRVGVSL